MSREMKESGFPWIGAIPADWKVAAIKRDFKIVSGSTPKSEVPEFWDGDIPWITPADYKTKDKYVSGGRKNISDEGYKSCGTVMVPAGSVIFSKRAPVGTVCINNIDLCTNQGCLSCIVNGDVDSTYYYYVMSVFTEQFELVSTGTTFKEISADTFANFMLPRPSLEEQKRIASYLDSVCRNIDLVLDRTEESIVEYKKLKQAVITNAVMKGFRENRPLKDSFVEWIGDIPEDWCVYRIANLYDERSESGLDELPILTVSINSGVSDHEIADEDKDRVFVRSEDRTKYKRVYPGDLAYNMMRAWQGAFGAVRVDGMVSPAYVVAKPKPGVHLDSRYMEALLRTPAAIEEMHRYSRGIVDFRLRLYWPEFKNIRICLPPLEEQREIADYIDQKSAELDALIAKKEQFLAELDNYKKSLIYEYVTGKKEVR